MILRKNKYGEIVLDCLNSKNEQKTIKIDNITCIKLYCNMFNIRLRHDIHYNYHLHYSKCYDISQIIVELKNLNKLFNIDIDFSYYDNNIIFINEIKYNLTYLRQIKLKKLNI